MDTRQIRCSVSTETDIQETLVPSDVDTDVVFSLEPLHEVCKVEERDLTRTPSGDEKHLEAPR